MSIENRGNEGIRSIGQPMTSPQTAPVEQQGKIGGHTVSSPAEPATSVRPPPPPPPPMARKIVPINEPGTGNPMVATATKTAQLTWAGGLLLAMNDMERNAASLHTLFEAKMALELQSRRLQARGETVPQEMIDAKQKLDAQILAKKEVLAQNAQTSVIGNTQKFEINEKAVQKYEAALQRTTDPGERKNLENLIRDLKQESAQLKAKNDRLTALAERYTEDIKRGEPFSIQHIEKKLEEKRFEAMRQPEIPMAVAAAPPQSKAVKGPAEQQARPAESGKPQKERETTSEERKEKFHNELERERDQRHLVEDFARGAKGAAAPQVTAAEAKTAPSPLQGAPVTAQERTATPTGTAAPTTPRESTAPQAPTLQMTKGASNERVEVKREQSQRSEESLQEGVPTTSLPGEEEISLPQGEERGVEIPTKATTTDQPTSVAKEEEIPLAPELQTTETGEAEPTTTQTETAEETPSLFEEGVTQPLTTSREAASVTETTTQEAAVTGLPEQEELPATSEKATSERVPVQGEETREVLREKAQAEPLKRAEGTQKQRVAEQVAEKRRETSAAAQAAQAAKIAPPPGSQPAAPLSPAQERERELPGAVESKGGTNTGDQGGQGGQQQPQDQGRQQQEEQP